MPESNQIEVAGAIHDGTVALTTAWHELNTATPDREAILAEIAKAEAACTAARQALSNLQPVTDNRLL